MREISLDRLRTLIAIVDRGSFQAAAQALHLAPPTVSLHVAELEARIGAPLLLRRRAGVVPTGVGEALIARARRLLADVDDTIETLASQVAGHSGRVRLGASTGALAHLLPSALEMLAREHPGIEVQAAVLTSAQTLDRLAAGMLDIGLVALPAVPPAGLRIQRWRRDPVMAFVPAQWSAPARVTPGWLARQPLILNDASTRLSRLTEAWFAAAAEQPVARIELNYNDAIKSLVAAGYGASLLPHEASAPPPEPRIRMLALRPALWRSLGIATRAGVSDKSTRQVLKVLGRLRQG